MKPLLALLFTAQLLFACDPTIICDSSVTVCNDTSFQIKWKTGAFVALAPYYYITVGYADTLPTFAGAMDSVAIEWLQGDCYRISLSGCPQCTSSIIVHWYDTPLPVELLRFWAEPFPDRVVLYWEVASESEGIYYQLFRNGFLMSTNIPGGRRNYEYRDWTVQPGEHEYFLACVEQSGRREILDSVTVLYGQDMQMVEPSMECYPNSTGMRIEFELPESMLVRIVVFNVLGQQVAMPICGLFNTGMHRINFNDFYLTSGIYLVRGRFGDEASVTRKMSLVK